MVVDIETNYDDSVMEESYVESDVGEWNSLKGAFIDSERSDSDESEKQEQNSSIKIVAGRRGYQMPVIPGEIDWSYRLSDELQARGFKRRH
jgi:hypothetical protein